MNTAEVNAKYESFKCTNKAINDDRARIRERVELLDNAYTGFIQIITNEGYEHTFSGWKKRKAKRIR